MIMIIQQFLSQLVFFSLKVLKLVRCFLLGQLRWSCGFHLFILLLKDSVMVCYIDFDMLSHPCIPGVNPVWLQHTILLICFWIWLAGILLRVFAQYIIVMLVCSFLSVFVWFWQQSNCFLLQRAWKCHILFNFLEILGGLVLTL